MSYNCVLLWQWSKGGNPVGLSHVVHKLLGKPLDKSMQVSNWEARPLSVWQTKYAAQDAHVLLLLYRYLVTHLGIIILRFYH